MSSSAFTSKLNLLPICRGLTEAEVRQVFDSADGDMARKGSWIFREGEPGDSLFIVLEGMVEVQKQLKDGSQQGLAKLGEGAVLGEMSLLNGNAPRSASALALNDVKLLRLPALRFTNLVKSDTVAALKIVHNLAQVMSRRLLMMDEKLVEQMDKGPKKKEELVDFQRILSNWSF